MIDGTRITERILKTGIMEALAVEGQTGVRPVTRVVSRVKVETGHGTKRTILQAVQVRIKA